MNTLILFETDRTEGDLFEIHDSKRSAHLREILKVQLGDEIRVGLLGGSFGLGVITSLNPMAIQVEWISKEPRSQPEISLSIGLSRPPTIKKILEHASSMGVKSFEFFRAQLSEKSYADSKIFEENSLDELLILGLSQGSLNLDLPKVAVKKSGVDSIALTSQSFVLSLDGEHSIWDYQIDFNSPIHFVLGPERGLTKDEDRSLIQRGFKPVKIHPAILRVEIATFSLLGTLEAMRTSPLRND